MKHSWKITGVLLILFFLAQIIGLLINYQYLDKDLPLKLEKPQVRERNTSFIQISIMIVIATLFAILLAKFKAANLWKIWFFISVVFCLTIAFGVLLPSMAALLLAFVLAGWRIFKDNVIIHNFTELFIYSGLTVVFLPILNMTSVVVLLIIISIYDMIAVFKTKHMIILAKFQSKLNLFTGFLIPTKEGVAILGGGDIGFPLLFASVIMRDIGYSYSFVIPIFATLGLFSMFYLAKKKKFYPAMPSISLACLFGYLIVELLKYLNKPPFF